MKIYEFIGKRIIFTNKFDFFLNILFSKVLWKITFGSLTETGGRRGFDPKFCLKPNENEKNFDTVSEIFFSFKYSAKIVIEKKPFGYNICM